MPRPGQAEAGALPRRVPTEGRGTDPVVQRFGEFWCEGLGDLGAKIP